jgi:hypothetical protein
MRTMEKYTDEELALEYLEGKWEHIQGCDVFKIIRPNSAQEKRARQALARLLRQPGKVSPSILYWLATLIDPAPQRFQTRQFAIVQRGRGVPPNFGRDIGIARYIAEQKEGGMKIDLVVSSAARLYRVSSAQAYRAWRKHRRRFERTLTLK